jgi:cobalt-zinc-cadmium efflux system protein
MCSDHVHSTHGLRQAKNRIRLAATLVLTLGYMVAEVVGGWLANSLALLADAGHMFSDAAALALSLFALWIAQRPPTPQHSFGYYRAEILAALANGATLVAIAGVVLVEAVARLGEPTPPRGELMMGIALGGLAVNLSGMALLHEGKAESLNIHGAWLHLLTDALGSVAALAAGGLVWAFGWHWADPAASIAIAILVVYSSWGLLRESIGVLMESAPRHLDVDRVRSALAAVPGVVEVHDLHVWAIAGPLVSLSAHVVLRADRSAADALADIRRAVHDQFGIDHITIQIEPPGGQVCDTGF